MSHLQRIKQVVSKIPGVTRVTRKGAR